MPNGRDAYWQRLRMAIEGFKGKYNKWPSQVRLRQDLIYIIKEILGQKSFNMLEKNIKLIPDEDSLEICAEDDTGLQFIYGKDMKEYQQPEISVKDWLGIDSIPE
jgi:hypothetical protein